MAQKFFGSFFQKELLPYFLTRQAIHPATAPNATKVNHCDVAAKLSPTTASGA
jgi:hypothetical protein